VQREGHLTALAFLVEENTEVSKPKTYELVLVVPGFAAPRASATSTRRERTRCAWGMQGTHVSPQCTTKLPGVESPAYACAHAAMFVISYAHRLRHVQQTGLCPPSQLGKEHSTLLARHGNGHQASLSEALLLSSVTATPTTCLAVSGGFIILCLASVLQVPQSYKQRPAADGKHGGPAAVHPAALILPRRMLFMLAAVWLVPTCYRPFKAKARAALQLTTHAGALTCTQCQKHLCSCGE